MLQYMLNSYRLSLNNIHHGHDQPFQMPRILDVKVEQVFVRIRALQVPWEVAEGVKEDQSQTSSLWC